MPPRAFPPGFLWGAATAAHQVEGYCTNNQWWAWEQEGGHIHDGRTSGTACDHWRRYDDDFRLARELGHTAQRISVEWSRIEPAEGVFDEAVLDHYRRVCDSIRRHDMLPTLTLHHFTNPIWAQRAGGWENPQIVDWLARFAERTARALGDRVAIWWTINEPSVAPLLCYLLGMHPPAVRDLGRALTVGRHTLLAHGAMYRALKTAFDGPAGVVVQMPFVEAQDPSDETHQVAAAQADGFLNQWYLDGLTTGAVPPPWGDGAEVPGLRDSCDVLGLNYYARMLVRPSAGGGFPDILGVRRDGESNDLIDEMGWEVHPRGLGQQLRRLAKLGKPLYVTENGMATLDDAMRTRHLHAHLAQVHAAIADGADVRGYFYWSLIDNFEWAEGYDRHFGLIAMDPDTLVRTPRPTALALRDIIARNALAD